MPGPDDNAPDPLGEATETRAMVRQARLRSGRSGDMSNRAFVVGLIAVVGVIAGFALVAHYWH